MWCVTIVYEAMTPVVTPGVDRAPTPPVPFSRYLLKHYIYRNKLSGALPTSILHSVTTNDSRGSDKSAKMMS